MPETRLFLGKVRGAEPEQLLLVEIYSDLSAVKRTEFTTEDKLRPVLRKNGMPESEINALFENARKHLV